MPRLPTAVLTSLLTLVLAACAAEPPQELRLLVKVAPSLVEPAAIAQQAARSSGKPVRYLAASGAQWHALALSCAGAADCEAAVQRLRDDRERFEAVQRDERKRIVTP